MLNRFLFIILLIPVLSFAEDRILPDPGRTPGDVLEHTTEKICKTGYTSTVRNVPEKLKHDVLKSYGISEKNHGELYEIDHLISLQLGGSNDIKNLWPEPYAGELGARKKDVLERKLNRLICAGKFDLSEAQRRISKNWIELYKEIIK